MSRAPCALSCSLDDEPVTGDACRLTMPSAQAALSCRRCAKRVLPSTAAKTGGQCLDCFYEEKRQALRQAERAPGCRVCDGSPSVAAFRFSCDEADQGRGVAAKYVRYLDAAREVKWGTRYVCSRCDAVWYRHRAAGRDWMTLIPAAYLPVFEAWCATPLPCPPALLDVARAIGATPPDAYGNGVDEVAIPCRAFTRQGEDIACAVLRFSAAPPVPWVDDTPSALPHFRLIADLTAITPSRFALPRAIRLQAARALEMRMGFSPTAVGTRDGRRFTLNGRRDFFDCEGVSGAELSLAPSDASAPLAPAPLAPPTIFAADWFPGAETLRIS